MNRLLVLFCICVIAVSFSTVGCAGGVGVPSGSLWHHVDGPIHAGPADKVSTAKVGESIVVGYLGVVAMGDASISAAAEAGGITTISHVDFTSDNLLGIIVTYTTKVYGD